MLIGIFGFQIYVPTNPRGAESLPPGIVVSESDFYLRRLWGEPSEVKSGETVNDDLKPETIRTFMLDVDICRSCS